MANCAICTALSFSPTCLSLVFGNQTAMVMESAPNDSGSASSLFGVIQYVFAEMVGVALSLAHNGTLLPPVLVMPVCAGGALVAWWVGRLDDPAYAVTMVVWENTSGLRMGMAQQADSILRRHLEALRERNTIDNHVAKAPDSALRDELSRWVRD